MPDGCMHRHSYDILAFLNKHQVLHICTAMLRCNQKSNQKKGWWISWDGTQLVLHCCTSRPRQLLAT